MRLLKLVEPVLQFIPEVEAPDKKVTFVYKSAIVLKLVSYAWWKSPATPHIGSIPWANIVDDSHAFHIPRKWLNRNTFPTIVDKS